MLKQEIFKNYEKTEFKFLKYPEILFLGEISKILDNPVEVYEKIDGGNAQIRKYNERIFCGCRSKFLTKEKYFTQEWFKPLQKWALSNKSFYNLPENIIVYGEWNSKHTLEYKPEFTDKFFIIDGFDIRKEKFIPYESLKEELNNLKIKDVYYLRKLYSGNITKEELRKLIGKSDYRDGKMEGVVIKDYTNNLFAKLYAPREKKGIDSEDVKGIILNLTDNNKEITQELVEKELIDNLRRHEADVPLSDIKKEVRKYLHKTH